MKQKSLSLFSYSPRSVRKSKASSDPIGPMIDLNVFVRVRVSIRAQGLLEVHAFQRVRLIQQRGQEMILAENPATGKIGIVPIMTLCLHAHLWNPYLDLLDIKDTKKLKRQILDYPKEMQRLLRAAQILREALDVLLVDELTLRPAGEHLRGETPFIVLAGEMIRQTSFEAPGENESWHSVTFPQEIALVIQTIIIRGNPNLAAYYLALRIFGPRVGVERAKTLLKNPLGELRECLFAIISTETQPIYMEMPKEPLLEDGQRVFKVPLSFFSRERMEALKNICKVNG